MMFQRFSSMHTESWIALRRRIIRETEVFLEEGLRHPERQIVIPAREVGRGGFSPMFASVFWTQVLATS